MNPLAQRLLTAAAVLGMAVLSVAADAQERRLVPPVRGEAAIEITKPNTRVVGTEIVTTITIKNVAGGNLAGFRVEETWYDKAGNAIGGDTYRHPRPLPNNEVITVELKTPRRPNMNQNQYVFSHANGTIKPTTVAKIEQPKPGTE